VKPPIVRPAAAADIEDAYGWYERQQIGLGDEFLAAANAVMKSVVANPLQFPIIHRQTHRALFHRFPYGLFYRIVEDQIVVVACMHARRDPRRWQSRQ
jgi:toxin ParE1/3/4